MKRKQLKKRRWGEMFAFLTIFLIGSIVFVLQLVSWAIPQLALYQEFVPARGLILDTQIAETEAHGTKRYAPLVQVEYQTENKAYRIWTFDLRTLQKNAKTFAQHREAEDQLKPFETGRRTICWYQASEPSQGVVVWDISFWGWCFLILSFALIILGLTGFWQSFRYLSVSKERQAYLITSPQHLQNASAHTTIPDIFSIDKSPGTHLAYRLPVGSRPVFPIIGLTIFAAVWNLVAIVIMLNLLVVPVETLADTIFGIILRGTFCLIGLILLWKVIRQLWTAFRVVPTLLELSDHPMYPDRKYRVLLYQNNTLRFERLAVDLVCEEVARFHQGTDIATSRKDVFRQTLFEQNNFTTSPEMPLEKEFVLQLPLGAMHSFRQENNEINWKLELVTQLVHWQEIRRDCPLIVRPAMFNDVMPEGLGL